MRITQPEVPRVEVRLNETKTRVGDHRLRRRASRSSPNSSPRTSPVKRLGEFQGTFYGLLGEPIPVQFALLESVRARRHRRSQRAGGDHAGRQDAASLITGKKEFNIDFLLGANLLKEFRTELDFRRNQVTFTSLTRADRHPSPDQNIFIEASARACAARSTAAAGSCSSSIPVPR